MRTLCISAGVVPGTDLGIASSTRGTGCDLGTEGNTVVQRVVVLTGKDVSHRGRCRLRRHNQSTVLHVHYGWIVQAVAD